MNHLLARLYDDEAGFVISAELVIISTLLVIGLIVGLAEVANGVNEELEDVGSAVGSMNQTYAVAGVKGHKAWKQGSNFKDQPDFCDGEHDISCDTQTYPEYPRY
ncbi:MAG: branched-chain amino acid aminotransferase [Planctomycetaceae bacterium]